MSEIELNFTVPQLIILLRHVAESAKREGNAPDLLEEIVSDLLTILTELDKRNVIVKKSETTTAKVS